MNTEKKDKENKHIWHVGLFLITLSSPFLYNWYKWEIDTPNFVCPDCETDQIYLVEYIDGDDLRNIETEEKANCVECKSAFSTLEGRNLYLNQFGIKLIRSHSSRHQT